MAALNDIKVSTTPSNADDGAPSSSCLEDAKRVFRLIEDERHMCAHDLYRNVKERLDKHIEAPAPPPQKLRFRRPSQIKNDSENLSDEQQAKEFLKAHRVELRRLRDRCKLFEKAKQNLNIDDDWTVAQTLFGVTTYYRREDDGSLSIKLEGRLSDVPLFDQVAVLREVDLHHTWAPFCSSSLTVAHLDKLDTVGWFVVGVPTFGLIRDACFRAIGCDSIYEDGSILLVAQGLADKPKEGDKPIKLKDKQKDKSVRPSTSNVSNSRTEAHAEFDFLSKDPALQDLSLPAAPTKMGSGRMTLRTFQAVINVESPTMASTRLIANVDPNLPLIPQSLIDFLMKKLCGVILFKLQNAAKKVSKDPIYNPHAIKMRQEGEFYGWLMRKFNTICNVRGWRMPPVMAFELSEQQQELAEAYAKKKGKATKNAIKFYHSLSDDKLDNFLDRSRRTGGSEPNYVGSGPILRTHKSDDDSDGVSELSHNSASTFSTLWRNNPIISYMRDVEEKTRLRKAREIEKSRERAANRLKPRELDEGTQSRLEELRQARERRLLGEKVNTRAVIPKDASKSERKIIKSQHKRDWATVWTSHQMSTRIVVILGLVAALFGVLYSNTVIEQRVSTPGSTWKKCIFMMLYIWVPVFVHFSLCYIALMYAFSSLQLGAIAGRQAMKFYSKNIHLIVAVSSAGMAVVGILKATVAVIARWFLWQVYWISVAIFGSSFSLNFGVMEKISNILNSQNFIIRLFFHNVIMKVIGWCILSIMAVLGGISSLYTSFADEAVAYHEGRLMVPTWWEDSYHTTRLLLSYSAFFLLMLLIVFNLSAKNARGPEELVNANGGIDATETSQSSDQQSRTGSIGSDEAQAPDIEPKESRETRRIRARSKSIPVFGTIPEAPEEDEGLNATSLTLTSDKKKRRGLFRRKKKKSDASTQDGKPTKATRASSM